MRHHFTRAGAVTETLGLLTEAQDTAWGQSPHLLLYRNPACYALAHLARLLSLLPSNRHCQLPTQCSSHSTSHE